MTKNKLKYNIIFKKVDEEHKAMEYPTTQEDIERYEEIKKLSKIVSEIQEPEIRYFTST